MGQRGPRPAPTALKLIKGERGDRVNDTEPVPGQLEVTAPGWLSPAALEVWDRLAPDLERSGVLTGWDVEAFARFCDAVFRHRKAAAMLDELGEVVAEPVLGMIGGERVVVGERLKRNPWALVWKQTDEVIARVGARFGLTPSDRADLKVDRAQDDDHGKEAYFS